jgi:hypothetical protein
LLHTLYTFNQRKQSWQSRKLRGVTSIKSHGPFLVLGPEPVFKARTQCLSRCLGSSGKKLLSLLSVYKVIISPAPPDLSVYLSDYVQCNGCSEFARSHWVVFFLDPKYVIAIDKLGI